MKRDDVTDYWVGHFDRDAPVDFESDPDALANVCESGAPQWLNEYYARHQRAVFTRLLERVPAPLIGAHALDVGCGAGRWCRLLADRGYQTVGIDLQPRLIVEDRERLPHIDFHCVSLEEFDPGQQFDLITSVTVLQHIPFDDQARAVEKIRRLTKADGHVLILENTRDQGKHVFSRSQTGWAELFATAGFEVIGQLPYDYSPLINVIRWLRQLRHRRDPPAAVGPARIDTHTLSNGPTGLMRTLLYAMLRPAVLLDNIFEPAFISLRPRIPYRHCGLAFRVPPEIPA